MSSLPYADNYFDGIICNQVLPHGKVAYIKQAISEIYRVLRKDGILFAAVISPEHPKYFTGEEIEPNTKINTDGLDSEVPHHFFTEQDMKEFFKDFETLKLEHFKGPSELNPKKRMAGWKIYVKKK